MFNLFLRNKILSGEDDEASNKEKSTSPGRARNRRIFERYSVDYKHLTLMNEQDILVVREISAKGFSTEVSKRGAERMQLGDVYEARIRYVGEIYDLQAKVTWKEETTVGFELVTAGKETVQFLKRLLRPMQIANSLQLVEATFMTEQDSGKKWYHGDEDSDLYVWTDANGRLQSWQLSIGTQYAEWNAKDGFATGELVALEGDDSLMGGNLSGLRHESHGTVDVLFKQVITDVIVALPLSFRDQLLATMME